MSLYYPQGGMTLRITWENFGDESNALLNDLYSLPVLARNISVTVNDYTEADTFSCEIDYKSFPFDPRAIRSAGVTIHLEDKKAIFRNSVLNKLHPTEDNTIFIGFADEETVQFDDENRVVRMEGRDLTSLLIDEKYTGPPIVLSKTIDKIYRDLLDLQLATENIEIENRTNEELPIFSQLAGDHDPKTAVRNSKRDESIWDIMQDLAARAGLIIFMELEKLVISKPQKLYDREKSKQFIYGKNIKTLEFKRKLGRHKGFNVKVTSINLREKKVETVLIPEDATTPGIKSPRVTVIQLDKKGKKIDPPKDAPFLTFRIPDITNREHLIAVGEKIFEELSRQQIEGKLETREMEIPEITEKNAKGQVVDTIPIAFSKIRNGTPLLITIDQDDLEDIRTVASVAQRKRFLIERSYPPKVAEAFAQSMNRISTPFYTKAVKFSLDKELGFKMDIDFINFIELDNSKLGV